VKRSCKAKQSRMVGVSCRHAVDCKDGVMVTAVVQLVLLLDPDSYLM
jgi:hypothetical protein